MGHWTTITAADGFELAAYRDGADDAEHCLVVGQEVFGVNGHMRYACAQLAEAGFAVIAPALLDRAERGVDLGYAAEDLQRGIALRARVDAKDTVADIEAARAIFGGRKVGIVGYCWGGLLVWRAAEQVTGLAAAVSYYGGGMTAGSEPSRKPAVPTMSHFGELDTHIPVDSVKAFEKLHPEVEVHLYDAHHGFNCEQRGAYNAGAAATALERSLFHFGKHVG
jgi:carboxymethylenebutenolidase